MEQSCSAHGDGEADREENPESLDILQTHAPRVLLPPTGPTSRSHHLLNEKLHK